MDCPISKTFKKCSGAPKENKLELVIEELQDWEEQLRHVDFDELEGPQL